MEIYKKTDVNELEQENVILKYHNKKLQNQNELTLNELNELKKEISKNEHKVNETIQEQQIQKRIKELELKKEHTELKDKVKSSSQRNYKITKKYYLTMVISAIIISVVVSSYSLFIVDYVVGQEHRIQNAEIMKSNYVIQNIKGDIINTWLSWRLTEGDALYINIVGAEKFPQHAESIKNIIFSEEIYNIDDSLTGKGTTGSTSLYYPGWTGALKAASTEPTVFPIPTNFEIIDSEIGAGDITIKMVDYANADGYGGFTKSIADESQNQILKSEITVYDADNLTDEQFATIVRQELGHALGLAHSTASEDLMAPDMINEFPYISECDVDAIKSLYDNGKLSTVICDK